MLATVLALALGAGLLIAGRAGSKTDSTDDRAETTMCTKDPKARWVSRSLEEEYLERVRAYRDTEPYRKALRKRSVWIEPLFGEAKEWHGSRRFRLMGLEKVNSRSQPSLVSWCPETSRQMHLGPSGTFSTS
jgi:hypothetical protein